MDLLEPKGSSSPLSSLDSVPNKIEPSGQEYVQDDLFVGTSNEDGTNLHRGLKARHITMVRFNLAVNIIQLIEPLHFLDSHRRRCRNRTYHRHWFSSSAGWSGLHLSQLHRCRFPRVPGHVCSRRDGSMASAIIWLYRLCCQIC